MIFHKEMFSANDEVGSDENAIQCHSTNISHFRYFLCDGHFSNLNWLHRLVSTRSLDGFQGFPTISFIS